MKTFNMTHKEVSMWKEGKSRMSPRTRMGQHFDREAVYGWRHHHVREIDPHPCRSGHHCHPGQARLFYNQTPSKPLQLLYTFRPLKCVVQ
jgi:hypothetical protein